MRAGNALLLLALLGAGLAQAEVTATVDRPRIYVGDSLVLTLRATDGEDVEDANLDSLAKDFDVVTRSTSSRMSIINGRTERTSELQVVLLPRRSGDLLIPSLSIDGQRTRQITVQVTEALDDLDNSRDIFVESEVDSESVYVQSQLIHTFRIYEATDLSDRGRSELKLDNAVVEELEGASFQRIVDGRAYRVYEVRHAIFPQQSGKLTIPALSFNARKPATRRSIFARGEIIRRSSDPLTVEVKPVPAAWPDAPWIPAASLEIEESWSALPDELDVGDSVTRTLTLVAEGIDGSQLPPVTQAEVPGIKIYPDQPRSENTRDNVGITGIGINSTALLFTEPGEFVLPAVRIPWWDTTTETLRHAEIPAKRIRVVASAPVDAPAAPPQDATAPAAQPAPIPQQGPALWMWTTLAALLGWLGTTLWLTWRMRKARPPAPEPEDRSEAESFRALLTACKSDRARDARTALQRWGQQYFGLSATPTLVFLEQRFANEEFSRALQSLERSLYGGQELNWDGTDLGRALQQCRKKRADRGGDAHSALPPLYESGS